MSQNLIIDGIIGYKTKRPSDQSDSDYVVRGAFVNRSILMLVVEAKDGTIVTAPADCFKMKRTEVKYARDHE